MPNQERSRMSRPTNPQRASSESDLEMVTRIARSMVGRWGMSERIGTLSVLPADGDPRMAGISSRMLVPRARQAPSRQ
jgi:hypothetical protein